MERKNNKRWLIVLAVALAASIGLSSCTGLWASLGIGPAGPDLEISGPIGGPGPGGPGGPPPPPPGGPGGPGGPW